MTKKAGSEARNLLFSSLKFFQLADSKALLFHNTAVNTLVAPADLQIVLQNTLKKIRERPQKIDDFPDNRMKIRFTYQQMLKSVIRRTPKATAMTPNEVLNAEYPGEEDFTEFMGYYNKARYSTQDIPDDAVDCARGILKQKM